MTKGTYIYTRELGWSDAEDRENGKAKRRKWDYFLTDTELLFGKVKHLWRWIVARDAEQGQRL